MWSDRVPEDRRLVLAAQLCSVVGRPAASQASTKRRLTGGATLDQVAQHIHSEPGFTWLHATGTDGARVPYLFHDPLATLRYQQGSCVIASPTNAAEVPGPGLDVLSAALDTWSGPSGALLAGFLGYDLAAEIEDLGVAPATGFSFPQLYFGLFDSVLSFEGGAWHLTCTDAWRDRDSLVNAAETILHAASKQVASKPGITQPWESLTVGPLQSKPDREAFEASVKRVVAAIGNGDIFQTNLVRALSTDLQASDTWELYQRMRAINPARYEAFIRLDAQHHVASMSPEAFLKVNQSVVESSPIKGTRPRAAEAAQDSGLAAELLASEKDRAELAMIVDVVRNDLARVCDAGSVRVANHAQLMTLPTVHHLVSTVSGRLHSGTTLVDLIRASFPPASISGAPKIEAMHVAQREEGQQRGPAMGAIGWMSLDSQQMELSVAIRTAFTETGKVHYYAGCGITTDSVATEEFAESQHKASAFLRALGSKHSPNQ